MRVVSGVYRFGGLLNTGMGGPNVYLLARDELTLVDTGFKGQHSLRYIIRELGRLGYVPSDISNIVITHHHPDHIGNLAKLKEITGARITAHRLDAPYIEGKLQQPGPAMLVWLHSTFETLLQALSADPVNVDVLVDDGDILPIFGGLKIVHTPGHTPGSISLHIEKEGLLFTGDAVNHRHGIHLPSRAFTVDFQQELESVRKIAGLDFDVVCFGHGLPIVKNANRRIARFADKVSGHVTIAA
jgi:glyoxylase-like metal-dependent hydrolase (beta-lactamase superfamily II)